MELRGSVRTLRPEVCDHVEALFHRAVYNTTAAKADRAAAAASAVVGAANVAREGNPTLAGEDFAFMLERVPGAYLFFGQQQGDRGGTPVHNPGYDFNDDLLPIGASYFAGLVEQELR